MDLRHPDARDRWDAVVAHADALVVGLDFDGTLSPIVDDPEAAVAHPEAADALVELARHVRAVAVVTGRPAEQVVRLGSLDDVASRLQGDEGGDRDDGDHGDDGDDGERVLLVRGQYGNERWSSATGELTSPEPPEGLVRFREALPGVLEEHDAAQAYVEDKGIALAVHTRRLPEPQAAFDRLVEPLTELARAHDLAVEPGRMVVEVRAPGMDKGQAVRDLVDELDAGAVLFAGDDLGDLEAFRAVAALRDDGLPGLLVCSGSTEQTALVELADVVVDGPDGVVDLLRRLASAVRR